MRTRNRKNVTGAKAPSHIFNSSIVCSRRSWIVGGERAILSVQLYPAFYFKHVFVLLFLHNSHGSKEIHDCGNLVRPD